MRITYFTSLVFLLLSSFMEAQVLFEPTFKNLEPIWQQRLLETEAPIDSFDIRYKSVSPFFLHTDDGDIYVHYYSNPGFPIHRGNTLVKFDAHNGEELHRFTANYLTSAIPEIFTDVHFRDDKIILTGSQHASDNGGINYIGDTRPKVWELNKDDLSLIYSYSNEMDTVGLPYVYYRRRYIPIANGIYDYWSNSYYGSDIVFDYYDNSDLLLDSTKIQVFPYESPTPPEFSEVKSILVPYDDNRIAAFVYYRDNNHPTLPKGAEFKLFELNDDGVSLLSKTDVKDYTYTFNGLGLDVFNIFSGNEQHIMYRQYIDLDGHVGNWLLWINEAGEIVHAQDKLEYEGNRYILLRQIDINEEYFHALAYPSVSGEEGYDVVRLSSEGEMELVGQFLTEGDISFINRLKTVLVDDKLIVIGSPIKNDERGGALIYAFDAEDLGVNVASSLLPTPQVAKRLELYPNPTSDYIQLKAKDAFYKYDIINNKGDLIRSGRIASVTESIDVRSLVSGAYYIRFSSDSGERYVSNFVKN